VPLLHCGLVLVKNCLLRERCLGRNAVGVLQLQRQEGSKVSRGRQTPRRSMSRQEQIRYIEKTNYSQLFYPRVGEHQEQPRRWPQIGRSPDCLRHVTLDLER
jgi:hypothetical protein